MYALEQRHVAQEVHERAGEMRKAIADEGGRRRDRNNDRSNEAEGESARRPLFQGETTGPYTYCRVFTRECWLGKGVALCLFNLPRNAERQFGVSTQTVDQRRIDSSVG